MNDKILLGTDCVLLSKNADNETISNNILESVQKAIGMLAKKIETNSTDKITSSKNYIPFWHLK